MQNQIEAILSECAALDQATAAQLEDCKSDILLLFHKSIQTVIQDSSEFIRCIPHAAYIYSEQHTENLDFFYAFIQLISHPASILLHSYFKKSNPHKEFITFLSSFHAPLSHHETEIQAYIVEQSSPVCFKVFDDRKNRMQEITLLDSQYSSSVIKMLKPWRKLKFKVHSIEQNQLFIHVDSIQLEPDFLIDATDIASCITQTSVSPLQFLVQKCLPDAGNPKAALGSVINDVADALLEGKQVNESVNSAFEFHKFRLSNYSYNWAKAKQEVEQVHVPNLLKFFHQNLSVPSASEVSILSSKQCFSGRLDLLHQQKDKIQITELKSGKAPHKGVWRSNDAQVAVYKQLLQAQFHQVETQVLYSSKSDQAIPIHTSKVSASDVQYARNIIITLIHELAEGKVTLLNYIAQANSSEVPSYMLDKLSKFQIAWNHATLEAKHWYSESTAFLLREFINSKTGVFSEPNRFQYGFSSLWKETNDTRTAKFISISGFKLHLLDNTIHIQFSNTTHHAFREGDRVVLFQNEENNSLNSTVYKSEILEIKHNSIVLERRKDLHEWMLKPGLNWTLGFDVYESGLWKLIQFNVQFLESGPEFQNMFLKAEVNPPEPLTYKPEQSNLSQHQYQVVEKALHAKNVFCMQGPPGTGKTSSFILSYLNTILDQSNERLILTAFTNKAVQEIEEKLLSQKVSFVSLSRKTSGIHLSEFLEGVPLHEVKQKLSEIRVLTSTLASLQTQFQYFARILSFDQLIIDEAGQLTEPHIAGLASYVNKLVLVGDHNQLPSVITQAEAYTQVRSKELQQSNYQKWSDSALERWFEMLPDTNKAIFTEHFRMHHDIAQSVQYAYGSQLSEFLPKQAISLHESLGFQPKWQNRILFFPTNTIEIGKISNQEAKQIQSLIQNRNEWTKPDYSIGIISPWKAQLANIRSVLQESETDFEGIIIDTVERFQGSENDVILYSCAVNNTVMLEAMASRNRAGVDRKLLVAVSRAKEQFVLIGNPELLQLNPQLKAIMDIAEWVY